MIIVDDTYGGSLAIMNLIIVLLLYHTTIPKDTITYYLYLYLTSSYSTIRLSLNDQRMIQNERLTTSPGAKKRRRQARREASQLSRESQEAGG